MQETTSFRFPIADGGTTFDSTINVSNNPGFSSEPEMAISGSNVYVVWRDKLSIII
ncbi:MAG: hypothetical protein WAJ93_12650 [Candidatus Nitrosopolaris sp.]